jgi:hypothetical protein
MGEEKYYTMAFLSLAVAGGEWSASSPLIYTFSISIYNLQYEISRLSQYQNFTFLSSLLN